MKTVSILRHAKSSWDNPLLEDFDRPIISKGLKRTARICDFIKQQDIFPDIVVSSPALRAMQTAEIVIENLKIKSSVKTMDAFYPGHAKAFFNQLKQADDVYSHIMIIGHNPGLSEFACNILNSNEASWIPTSGLVVVNFDCRCWNQIAMGNGMLVHFIKPKELLV